MNKKVRYSKYILGMLIFSIFGNFANAQKLPDKPRINYVSYEANTSKLTIDWSPSESDNIASYRIYTLNKYTSSPVSGSLLDEVPSDSLHYTYDPGTLEPKVYSITAVDTSGNQSILGGDFHKAVRLDMSYDSCKETFNLAWDKYIGWKNNLSGYRIYYAEDDGDFILEHTEIDTSKLYYTVEGIKENINYTFYIEAFSNRGTRSMSVFRKKYTYMPPPPSYINLDYVTVLNERTIELSFTPELNGLIDDFRISRSLSLNGNYSPVQQITDIIEPNVIVNDNVVTQGESYYYKVEALNSCLAPIASSNIANNILLKGSTEGSIVNLNWTPYTNFASDVDEYRIFRKNQYLEYEIVGSTDPTTSYYSEDVSLSGDNTMKGEVEYCVEAIESGANPLGLSGVSKSNEIKVNVETKIYLPNAFTPDNNGHNDFFEPIFDFIPRQYKMLIFDRSGKNIFYSEDPTLGWDGSLNGSGKATEGVYVYHVVYLSYSGSRKEKTGNVTLIYP